MIEMFHIYKFETVRKLFLRLTDVLDNWNQREDS